MKKMLFTLFLFGAGLFITGCFVDTTWPFIGGDVVNEKTILGITAPVEGKNPVTEIDANQYTGKVTWLPTVGPEGSFKGKQVYTAVITLAPKSGYTFLGIQKNFFTVDGADSASNSVCSTFDECVVRAVFPNTTPFPPEIKGVTVPVVGETPVYIISGRDDYKGSISWSPNHNQFLPNVSYTATIELTGLNGYSLPAIDDADYFTIGGTESCLYDYLTGKVTATFPKTIDGLTFPSEIKGVTAPVVGETPVYIISGREDYKGSISWSPNDNPFSSNVTYIATIVLTGLNGYSLSAIDDADYFTVAGAESCLYDYSTGKVTATFPKTSGGLTFKMAHVPSDLSFKIGEDDEVPGDDNLNTIEKAYSIGETEVTYELWYEVRTWGENNGYVFANKGKEGNDGTAGAEPTDAKQEPVTTVSWRDAVVWCNALTEWHNAKKGTSFDCVYYTDSNYTAPLKKSHYVNSLNDDPGGDDNPYIKAVESGNIDIYECTAKGFRLPTSAEWSAAARYKSSDSSNEAYEYPKGSGMWWTPGNYASGDIQPSGTSATLGDYAVYQTNSGSKTASVKSKKLNALGLYDMSGNVSEWAFDMTTNSNRLLRGGSYDKTLGYMKIGLTLYYPPSGRYFSVGFRFVRTE